MIDCVFFYPISSIVYFDNHGAIVFFNAEGELQFEAFKYLPFEESKYLIQIRNDGKEYYFINSNAGSSTQVEIVEGVEAYMVRGKVPVGDTVIYSCRDLATKVLSEVELPKWLLDFPLDVGDIFAIYRGETKTVIAVETESCLIPKKKD